MTQVPTRLLVLQRLQAHLETISIADGYQWDLAGKVFRGRILFGQEIKPLPAISLLESPRSDPSVQYAGDWRDTRNEGWPILVQGLIEDDIKHPTDKAYELAAAVEMHLSRIGAEDFAGNPAYPDVFNLGGLINGIEIGSSVVRPPEEKISATAFFFLPLKVGIALPSGQPYTTV